MMISDNGIFTISLDFELYWGVRDKRSPETYGENLKGTRNAIDEILTAFAEYGIHATWAAVGFLFFSDLKSMKGSLPDKTADYANLNFSPYPYIKRSEQLDDEIHFAPDVIEQIKRADNQELATHTFSHYYCMEEGSGKESFRADLQRAVAVAVANKVKFKSLVFPRDQIDERKKYILNDLDIKCYRGFGSSSIYKPYREENLSKLIKAIKLIDSYINLTGHNTFDLCKMNDKLPFNIPASRFLRPFARSRRLLDGVKLSRIKKSMTHAAQNNELFHLWWHPHNFGANTKENMGFLIEILRHYRCLEKDYGLRSMNMGEIADCLENSSQC